MRLFQEVTSRDGFDFNRLTNSALNAETGANCMCVYQALPDDREHRLPLAFGPISVLHHGRSISGYGYTVKWFGERITTPWTVSPARRTRSSRADARGRRTRAATGAPTAAHALSAAADAGMATAAAWRAHPAERPAGGSPAGCSGGTSCCRRLADRNRSARTGRSPGACCTASLDAPGQGAADARGSISCTGAGAARSVTGR